jgi:Acetyltransferase (GNAT) domain
VLHEVRRQRELTLRAVGKGTGKALDLDSFDLYYTHLVLWHKHERCIAGAYRLAWTDDLPCPCSWARSALAPITAPAAVALIVEYLRQRRLRSGLARLVAPRHPFRTRLTRSDEIRCVAACLSDIEDLAKPLAEIEAGLKVPVLLRQYVRLGGGIAAFNVDHHFSNVLDGLLVLDLRETAPKLLAKYMGRESAAAFLRQACGACSA